MEGDAEHPIVVARLFDTSMTAPISPATGQPVQPGEVGLFLDGGCSVHVTKDRLFIKGQVVVDGSLQVSQDVSAGTVSLVGHKHLAVQPGQGVSGIPEQAGG